MKVDDIKADYKDKIKSAKHDSSISKDERKNIVKQRKAGHDQNIHDLKNKLLQTKNYSKATGVDPVGKTAAGIATGLFHQKNSLFFISLL